METYTCQLYNCNIFEMVLQGCHGGIFSLLCWNHFQNPFKLFTISITSDMIRLFLLFEGNFFQNLSLNLLHRGGYVVPGSPGSKSSDSELLNQRSIFGKRQKFHLQSIVISVMAKWLDKMTRIVENVSRDHGPRRRKSRHGTFKSLLSGNISQ